MLESVALAFTGFCERWLPDAFVFALVATAIVFASGLAIGAQPAALVDAWGAGFWDLVGFTMQMAVVVVTGYVVASAGPVEKLIRALARVPQSSKGAVAMVTAFAMLTSWLNWGFSLIFSAVLAREIARHRARIDYRALCAATLLGLGSVWAQGLSGSAALQMATAGALSAPIREIVAHGGRVPGGIITFSHTIFLWQSLVSVAIELVIVTAVMWLATPDDARAVDAAQLGVTFDEPVVSRGASALTPGERLEHSRVPTLLVVALGATYLVRVFGKEGGSSALTLNTINFTLLLVGMALHGTPARLMAAVRAATPATWGILLQFPFYAGIAG